MKKFFYFIASVLGLCVIFGSGWAAGVNKLAAVGAATEISEPVTEDKVSPDESRQNDGCGECPDEKNSENSEGTIRFRFEIPSPADFRNRIFRFHGIQ